MVARPPVRIRVERMTLDDIPLVHEIERASFPVPWPAYAFRQELEANRLARYLVVRAGQETVAYAGIWLMVDEAHVTTFAVLPAWRRKGVGARLLLAVLHLAMEVGASVATLEVRLGNVAARRLYQRFGFRPVGVRPRYYSDNGEDALIMTTDLLTSPQMQRRLDDLSQHYSGDWLADDGDDDGGADGSDERAGTLGSHGAWDTERLDMDVDGGE
jgi:[ribosomal protein S18]-alanine N-acetyltransferase